MRPAPTPGALPRGVAAGALLVLTLLAYLPALGAGYIWDDDVYVTDNPVLRSVDGLRRIWLEPRSLPQYYPLVHTSFWIEYRLWGLHSAGYHTVNVLLHAASALTLWTLLRRLGLPGAWLAAAIFALHPVHVESVAWVTERKNVLSGLLYLGALLCFARAFRLEPGSDRGEKATRAGAAPAAGGNRWRPGPSASGAALFVAALLAKTVTATLPVAVALLVWWRRGRVARAELARLLPLAAIGVALGLATVWLEKHHVGAEGADWSLGPLDRVVLAGRALWFYLGKLVWPSGLSFVYPRWEVSAGVWWQWLYPAGALAVAAGLWLGRGRLGRGPLTAGLFFAVTLAPALGFFDVYPFRFSFVADHFQYLASLGPIVLGAAWLARGAAALGAPVAARVAAGALLAVLGSLTLVQARAYEGAETLWRATLARNPEAWLAHNNLGILLMRRGDLAAAAGHFGETIRIKPESTEGRANLATVLARGGRIEESRAMLEEALRQKPDSPVLWYNLGLAHVRLGDLAAAERSFREALRNRPAYPEARSNLANVLVLTGRAAEAIPHLEQALRERPGLTTAAFSLGRTRQALGQLDLAAAAYRELLRWRPDDREARLHLADVLDRLGRPGEAAAERRAAARPAPAR